MATYVLQFTTDHRKTVNFDVQNPPLRFNIMYEGMELTASLILYGTVAFNVEVTSQHDVGDLGKLGDVVQAVMAGLYDSVGLSIGAPLEVRLAGVWEVSTGRSGPFTVALPTFDSEIANAGLNTNDWISIGVNSPQLRAALQDIRLAMQTPGEVPAHCYRAIERIRQVFSAAGEEGRNPSWARLRTALNMEKSWLNSYRSHAEAARHGELVLLTREERDACLRQAATVVIRFAAYLKANGVNLSAPVFPLLT
jgi:hypothetical protein